MQEQERNVFDELGFQDPEVTKQLMEEQRIKGEKLDMLIHQVFQQNEQGKELLDMWAQTLILTPTAQPGMDLTEIGINEGAKTFIRNIMLTVAKVEAGNE